MSITFIEQELQDGYIQISWKADTPREWQRILQTIKDLIPKEQRVYVPSTKSWTISPTARTLYESIKSVLLGEDAESVLASPYDAIIEEDALLSALNHELLQLPASMRARALFAIRAAIGLEETPVQFCFSRNAFGAWNEAHRVWYYEDGRYSSLSPSEWDRKALSSAYKRMRTAQERFSDLLEGLDRPLTPYKQEFRLEMLEKYDYRCFTCGVRPIDLSRLQMHRVLPGRLGGLYVEDNVVLLCTKCHRRLEGHDWSAVREQRQEYLLKQQADL